MSVSVSLHTHQHLAWSIFNLRHSNRFIAISHSAFIGFFLVIDNVEHLFTYFFCYPFVTFTKVSVQMFCHLKTGLFVYLLSFEYCLYILESSPFSDICFAIFFLSLWLVLLLLTVSFEEPKFLILIKSIYPFTGFGVISKNIWENRL